MSKEYIFNIGLNRSGTTSLCNALEILNIPSLHYSYRSTPLTRIIKRNVKDRRKFFYGLDKHEAFLDFNGEDIFKKLHFQYPKSKFILTTRPLDDWIKSYMYMIERDFPHKLKTKSARQRLYEDKKNLYINRTTRIRTFFRKKSEQFLELNICEGDGWDKLCPFLNKPIPEVEFPWDNKSG